MAKLRAASSKALLTTPEYAEIRGCSPRTIEHERQQGTGARFLKINGQVRYRQEDIADFLAAAERTSTKEAAK